MKKSQKIIGAGIALTAIAAAATYFLTGKRGQKNREKISAWTLKMKGDVLAKMQKMKKVNRETFHAIVDDVADRYAQIEHISAEELDHLKEEIKGAWTHVRKQLN